MKLASSPLLVKFYNHAFLASATINKDIPSRCKYSSGRNIYDVQQGPSLEYFLANAGKDSPKKSSVPEKPSVSYLGDACFHGRNRKVYFETYGCQMNVNDTEITWAILQNHGFCKTDNIKDCDVILVMTCAIREGAERKIWKRLEYLKRMKQRQQQRQNKSLKIGILGCMAERLKKKILEKEKMVDLVCGPDAYRDLPHMLAVTDSGQTAVNVMLSLEETYADVVPVRINENSISAFVSTMRGCDNMCSYCIVPFTRGRERSRPIKSILEEVKTLSEMGVKEVTLLGQNVNSYRDMSVLNSVPDLASTQTQLANGFKTVYKSKVGGQRFVDLLDKVSEIDPEMRFRFTSPHPKDFPDEVLSLIKERPNICNQLHLPAQSGSTRMLDAMRRGYTREAYLDLVDNIRDILPNVTLTSDFIAGFCGEAEEDHQQTMSLMRSVKYNYAFCFPYSMRQKTHAYHKLEDNVPEDIKSRRHMELISVFREEALKLNMAQLNQIHLVLVEAESKRSSDYLAGKNDASTKVIFQKCDLPCDEINRIRRPVQIGDYVAVKITGASSQVLKGDALYITSLKEHYSKTRNYYSSVGIR